MAANTEPASGGVSEHLSQLARELECRRVDIDLMWRTPLARRCKGPISWAVFGVQVAIRARRGDYDLCHAHSGDGFAVKPYFRSSYIMTSHGDERSAGEAQPEKQTLPRKAVRRTRIWRYARAVRTADAVIALHDEERDSFAKERGPARLTVSIPNGTALAIERGTPTPGRIAIVGSWSYRKGSDVIPSILHDLRQQVPWATLDLLGPGKEVIDAFESEDRANIRASGWLGPEVLARRLRLADCLFIPSRKEGMPLVVLDALACGLPIIGSDLSGIRSTTRGASLLRPFDDWRAFPHDLARVVTDREFRELLSDRALSVATRYNWISVAEETHQLYLDVIAKSRRRGRSASLTEQG